ncbi:hypothetical protein Dsin_003495 [Dipteronia sinensis]|uniref:MATH domain-containing protein n=1 Tax=Dipteronia sinensis TaxID=43782 RepID=A0AAE0B923_9ROSI|nr:hypothetical protein Dsin_003495 [Dipteronia sinensis]
MAIEMLREERDVQPVQFLLNVDSYSLLPTEQGEKYESEYIGFGGFTWKLILYPNGDKSPYGKGYISFYLEIHQDTFLAHVENYTVCIDFKCFVLNKIKNKYLTIQDGKGALMYFDKLRSVQGFSQMVSIDTFKNPLNGYLVEDSCAFGAEFFIIQPAVPRARHEFLSLVKDPKGTTDDVSLNWYDEPTKERGFVDFMPLSEILEPGNGYIQDDTLLVQLKFDVVSEFKLQ